jgi:hypothetical protein
VKGRSSRRAATFALAAAIAPLFAALPTRAAEPFAAPGHHRLRDEGVLGNESRVPHDEATSAAFAAADGELAARRANRTDLAPVFEAWLAAAAGADRERLVATAAAPGETIAADRLYESVEVALARRIQWLGEDERARWREHVGALAAQRFAAARNASQPRAAFARVEADLPGTPEALRALLVLCDDALASGELVRAGGWLARARDASKLAARDSRAAFDRALESRAAALAALAPRAAAQDSAQAFVAAGGFEAAGAIALEDPVGPSPRVAGFAPAVGLFAGLVVLDDGRWCVQTASRLHFVDPGANSGATPRLVERFEPGLLVEDLVGATLMPYPTGAAPGWRFTPVTDGRDVGAVVGRGRPGSNTSNALARFAPPPAKRAPGAQPDSFLARCVWARSVGGHAAPDGSVTPLPEFSGAEYQAGPALVGDVLAAQVRRGSGDVEAALEMVDWHTGALLSRRVLCIGREVGPDLGRFSAGPARGAGSPLVAVGTRVVVATNLGVVALVDTLDGRVWWCLRTQRTRGDDEVGATAGTRHVATERSVHVGPADSDFVYELPLGPFEDAAPGPASLAEPLALEETLFIAGALHTGPRVRLVTAVRSGPRSALALLDPASGAVVPGVFLPLGEGLCEGVHVAPRGDVVVASGERHVYLFDGTRELFLAAEFTLPDPHAPRPRGKNPPVGGSVHVSGTRLCVLSNDALVFLRPKRPSGG